MCSLEEAVKLLLMYTRGCVRGTAKYISVYKLWVGESPIDSHGKGSERKENIRDISFMRNLAQANPVTQFSNDVTLFVIVIILIFNRHGGVVN